MSREHSQAEKNPPCAGEGCQFEESRMCIYILHYIMKVRS